MKKCYVMVGVPASGKSTFVKNVISVDPEHFFVYSTDQFIDDAATHFNSTYNEMFESNIKGATASMNKLLEEAVADKRQWIIWDQTNLGIKKRKTIIDKMKSMGYSVKCVSFIPPETQDELAEWTRRLESRPGKTIPDHILNSMMANYQKPELSEGFDDIETYDMFGTVIT